MKLSSVVYMVAPTAEQPDNLVPIKLAILVGNKKCSHELPKYKCFVFVFLVSMIRVLVKAWQVNPSALICCIPAPFSICHRGIPTGEVVDLLQLRIVKPPDDQFPGATLVITVKSRDGLSKLVADMEKCGLVVEESILQKPKPELHVLLLPQWYFNLVQR